MFDETPESANQPNNQTKAVEDIFAATDKAPAAPPAGGSSGAPSIASAPMPPSGAATTPSLGPPSALSQGKLQPAAGAASAPVPSGQLSGVGGLSSHAKGLILLVVIGIVAVSGTLVGWWLWPGRNSTDANLAPTNPIQAGKEAVEKGGAAVGSAIEGIQQDSMQKALNPFEQNPSSGSGSSTGTEPGVASGAEAAANTPPADDKTDTDQDGLTDAEETALGANPRLADSDADGLSDWEEVKVWDTNLLNADSDGDGYKDGEEVQHGYNPKGPGKLLDFEKAKQKAQ